MRKAVMCVVALMTLAGCVSEMPKETLREVGKIITDMNGIESRQEQMIANREPADQVYQLVREAKTKRFEIYRICQDRDRVQVSLYETCSSFALASDPQIARMELRSADYYASTGDKLIAKELYQYIISTYATPYYDSFLQKAGSGLENLELRK